MNVLSILFNKKPITVNTELAEKIGLNESIIVQQLNYWLEHNKETRNNYRDGYYWTYNTYEEWQKQFPFWSVSTIKRTFIKLEKDGWVVSGNYNKLKIDRTKWYRLNYEKLETLDNPPKCQIDTMDGSLCADATVQYDPTITRDYTENTTETNLYVIEHDDPFIDFYLRAYEFYFNKEHMRVSKENLIYIQRTIEIFHDRDIELDEWQEKVVEHLENLPDSNNGSIVAFLKASFRYFEIDPERAIG